MLRGALLVLLVAAAACGPAAGPAPVAPSGTPRRPLGPNDTEYTIRHDNVLRTYVLHVPAGTDPKAPMPVVVVMWDSGSADAAVAQSGWTQLADAEGFLVAYAQADRGIWNDGSLSGEAGRVKNGDVAYLSAVVTDVNRHVTVDRGRVYAAGFGNGGSLAWVTAGQAGHVFAAVGAVGGHLFPATLSIARAASFLYIVGSADPQYPIAGGRVVDGFGNPQVRPPVQDTFDRWAAIARCAPPLAIVTDGPVRRASYACRDDSESVIAVVDHLAHIWPRRLPSERRDPIDAPATLWDFFKKHSRS